LALTLAAATAGLGLPAADGPKPTEVAPPAAKPRLVTLKGDMTLDKALDELQKQTDVAIDRTRAETTRTVKLDCDGVPFWAALEQIAKAADHRIAFAEQGRSILLMGGEGVAYRELPLSIDGPFRVAVRQVVATQDLENDRTFYDVLLGLHWELHFSAFLVESPGKTVTARDNTDKELTVAESRGRMPVSGGGTRLMIRLADVPRSARTIKLFEGTFNVVGTGRMLRFEFGKLSGKEEQTLKEDGVTAKVRADFPAGGDLWTARVELEYPEGGPALESFESAAWLADNDAFLVSADNKKRLDVNGGTEVASQSERRAVVNYRWVPQGNANDLGKPDGWKLVVRTPSKLVEVPVKFKLENIPLP
jgi:hypothetical protein